MPSNSVKPDLVFDCPQCGERVEVIGLTWEWIDELMYEVVDKPNRHAYRCQRYLIVMATLLMLEQHTILASESQTIVIKEIDAGIQSLPAAERGPLQLGAETDPR